ncbi:MAG: MarR family transcriptional regulator, partial [Gemmatimonadaceae bacterium]
MNYSSVCDWQPLQLSDGLRIVPYRPEHAAAFRDLNLAWIRKYFVVEERDERDLGDPDMHILSRSGHILIAELRDETVGTCALMLESEGVYE